MPTCYIYGFFRGQVLCAASVTHKSTWFKCSHHAACQTDILHSKTCTEETGNRDRAENMGGKRVIWIRQTWLFNIYFYYFIFSWIYSISVVNITNRKQQQMKQSNLLKALVPSFSLCVQWAGWVTCVGDCCLGFLGSAGAVLLQGEPMETLMCQEGHEVRRAGRLGDFKLGDGLRRKRRFFSYFSLLFSRQILNSFSS